MSLSTLHALIDRIDQLEQRLERTEKAAPRWIGIREAAQKANYSYSRFKVIRTRFGFEPGARYVDARAFFDALERERRAGR